MEQARSALLMYLTAQISGEQRVRYTRTGFLGLPPELYWENPSCFPLVDPDIVDKDLWVIPARIMPGLPQGAEECATVALSSAIVNADDYESVISEVATAFSDRVAEGYSLDPGAIADLLSETHAEISRRGLVGHAGGRQRIMKVMLALQRGISTVVRKLFVDQWKVAYEGKCKFDALRNISTFYARLRCLGLILDEEFNECVEGILEEYTEGNLGLLGIAVIYLLSPATMASTRIPIPTYHWTIAQQQLNEIEGRIHAARGRVVEDEVVELLCGMSPSRNNDSEPTFDSGIQLGSSDVGPEGSISGALSGNNPYFSLYLRTIHYLRSVLTELQDADEAPLLKHKPTSRPCVEYCTDPPPLGSHKWHYLYALCKSIQIWATCPEGVSADIAWRSDMKTLQLEAEREVLDPDAEIYEQGVGVTEWAEYHKKCDRREEKYEGNEYNEILDVGAVGVDQEVAGNGDQSVVGAKQAAPDLTIGPVPGEKKRQRSGKSQ